MTAFSDDPFATRAGGEADLPNVSDMDAKAVRARVAELAELDPLDYEVQREAEARALGIRVSVLDKEVERRRPKSEVAEREEPVGPFEDVEPWPEPVRGDELLDELRATLLRFCVLPEHTPELVAAWIVHAWTHDAAEISPVLCLVSPEKRCGKTTTMNVVAALVPRALRAVNLTTSVAFRVVEAHKPTLLVDEADTFLADNDELRGIINGGHDRMSAWVWRSVGDEHEPRAFNVWSPKAIAMIGRPPDTIEDRSLVVRLRRKARGESVERFRTAMVAELLPLRRRCMRFAQDNEARLAQAEPNLPDVLNDRAQDNARAICAIADEAGGHWPDALRRALVGNAEAAQDDEPESSGALLLSDIAQILETVTADRIGSSALVERLTELDESPWAEWRRGRPITARGVKKLLAPYKIAPRRDRRGMYYSRADFADAIARYVSNTGCNNPAHPTHPAHGHSPFTEKGNGNNGMCSDVGCVGFSGGVPRDTREAAQRARVAEAFADYDALDETAPDAWA